MAVTTYEVVYRMLVCKTCKHVYRWIDERMPTFCPECGKIAYKNVSTEFEQTNAVVLING